MRKKLKQDTLFGNDVVKVSTKKRIQRGTLNFYPVKVKTFEGIINELETVHNRTKFYAMFSGGKDSMTVAHKLAEMEKLEKIVHVKTNVGLQMTTDFVKDICQEYGWDLQIIEPQPKFIYASFILQYGFPSSGAHKYIMFKLKYEAMRDFAFSADKKNHCLIGGIRKFESQRRMGNYPEPIQKDGGLWFGAPIFYYTTEETYRYVHENGLKISPAYKLGLGTSGECMCGSFASKGEKLLINELDPKLAKYIKWLEDGIQEFGTPEAKKFPKWGLSAKMSEIEQQQYINTFFAKNPDFVNLDEIESAICGSECGPGTLRGETDW